jgi:hypothetical protein
MKNITFIFRLGPRPVQALIFILSGLLLMGSITLQEMLPKSYDNNGNDSYFIVINDSVK